MYVLRFHDMSTCWRREEGGSGLTHRQGRISCVLRGRVPQSSVECQVRSEYCSHQGWSSLFVSSELSRPRLFRSRRTACHTETKKPHKIYVFWALKELENDMLPKFTLTSISARLPSPITRSLNSRFFPSTEPTPCKVLHTNKDGFNTYLSSFFGVNRHTWV